MGSVEANTELKSICSAGKRVCADDEPKETGLELFFVLSFWLCVALKPCFRFEGRGCVCTCNYVNYKFFSSFFLGVLCRPNSS